MRTLIVGFGKMGMLHAATVRMLPGGGDIVIAETSPLVRQGIAAIAPGTRVVADYTEALADPALTHAVIATPTASHAPIFQRIAARVPRIFVEKPFAADHASARAAADRLSPGARGGVRVGHCIRFSPLFLEAKRLLDAGAVGTIERFDASMFSSDVLKPAKSWRFKGAAAGGGVLLDLGSHLVDMVRFFFGMPDELTGRTESLVSAGTEDRFESEWSYAGFAGRLESSWSKPDCRKASLQVRVQGSNGELSVSDDAVDLRLASPAAGLPAGATRRSITALEHAVPFDLAGTVYAMQLEAWWNAPLAGGTAVNSLDESLADLRLLDAIRRSRGQRVRP
jgi:predicted dehydrogenase